MSAALHWYDASALSRVLDYDSLIDALKQAFSEAFDAPARFHATIEVPGKTDATLLLMPAWTSGRYIGVKTATIFPGNVEEQVPSVMATYLLLDGRTGFPLATMDGRELTRRRTGAASALAARYLARPDVATLLMIGAGSLSEPLVRAHLAVRDYDCVLLWNRSRDRVETLARTLADLDVSVRIADNLAEAVSKADVISCATLSSEPLVRGKLVKPGTHVDLVGAFTSRMRESDDDLIASSRIFVDTRAGARNEAGDLIQPDRSGAWSLDQIDADLFELARGDHYGRRHEHDVTVFKSVGASIEDLAAAMLAFERLSAEA